MALLTQEDHDLVTAAVAAAERDSDGEIVTIVAGRVASGVTKTSFSSTSLSARSWAPVERKRARERKAGKKKRPPQVLL